MNGSLELRIPLFKKMALWTVAFLDWGLLARDASEISEKAVRVSAGFGLRYLVGDQIPIRLDFGFPLGESRLIAPCGAGEVCANESLFELHFGFLYPF